ncbi:hypothetical protein Ddye_021770 [Dipteronia dyeriana]|uniref:Reverse transcriptase zinc-binding domain-containing protein n=1 Tax=Dipteronia dyeriana TaxID=168575 RepID=A0AAD9WYB2_9ROSI|nr:hypothetical protein Ddye_021770 [Dipteronia dyeriana]
MAPSDGWNIQKLLENFVQYDVHGILQIPIGMCGVEDPKVWHFNKNGVFYVKSGYWVGRNLCNKNCQPSAHVTVDWWKWMWMLDIPSKIKLFIWKACHAWIPTKANLCRKGINCDDICLVCNKKSESTLHSILDCSKLKFARARNEWMHNGKFFDADNVVWWSKNYVEEFQSASHMRDHGGDRDVRGRIEVDSEMVINHIMKASNTESAYASILDSIVTLASSLMKVSFLHISSQANRVAWALEKFGMIRQRHLIVCLGALVLW